MTSEPTHQLATRANKRYSPDLLMYVTAAFMWVAIWRFQDLWPIIGKLQIPIALEVVLALSIAASFNGPRQLKWVKSRILAIPFLLLAIMVVGTPFSLWIGKTVTFISKDFAPSLLLMVGVVMSVREAEDLDWLAFAHVVGATAYSLYIYLFIPVGSDGRLGDLAFYDANDFALLVVCTIPFAIYFLRPGVVAWKRLFALFSLGLFIEMIMKSGSRGGFIAFVVLALYVIVAFRAIPTRLRITAVTIGLVMMTVLGSTAYWTMMSSILHPKDDYNMTSEVGRKFIWKRGVGYMITHPVLGVGAANFAQAEGTISAISKQFAAENRGLKWSTAHNSFVLVGAELGVGALVLFVTMLGTSVLHLFRIKSGPDGDPLFNPGDEAFAQTLIASLVAFCVAGFFVSAAYFAFLYALIGMIVAEDSFRRRRAALAVRHQIVPQATTRPAAQSPRRAPREHWLPAG